MRLKLLLLLLLLPQMLLAQEQSIDEQAKSAYRYGQALFAEGQYDAAAAAFGEANALKPAWKILYNKGQAEAAAKRYGLALESFEACLALSGDELQVARKDEVLAEIRRMRDMVGSLEVTGPDGAVVFVDGVNRGTLPLDGPVRIVAGTSLEVEVKQGDDILVAQSVRLGSGDTRQFDVAAAIVTGQSSEGTEAAMPLADENAGDTGKKLRVAGWVSVGMGGAALVAGSVLGAMALSANADLVDSCDGGDCTPGDHDALDQRDLKAGLSTGFVIGGGLIAATGVVLLVVGNKRETAQVSLVPGLSPRFAGFAVTGRF